MDGYDELEKRYAAITGSKLPTRKSLTPVKSEYDNFIEESANRHGVDPDLVRAMIKQESDGKRYAKSYKGATGLMQLMPGTAKRFGVTDVYNPQQNIEGGTKYIKWLLDKFDGDVDKALAGYNAGEGRVLQYGGIPPFKETQNYVKSIRSNYKGNGYRNQSNVNVDEFADLGKRYAAITGGVSSDSDLTKNYDELGKQYAKFSNQFANQTEVITQPTPVPETSATIKAQIASTLDTNSPRQAFLLTDGETLPPEFSGVIGQFLPVQTPQGMLFVNGAKTGLKSYNDALKFVEQNGVAKLIGKVEDVSDTSNKAALLTTDRDGNELSSSVITSPATAIKQADVDKLQFGNLVGNQTVVPTDVVAQKRFKDQRVRGISKI